MIVISSGVYLFYTTQRAASGLNRLVFATKGQGSQGALSWNISLIINSSVIESQVQAVIMPRDYMLERQLNGNQGEDREAKPRNPMSLCGV
jgi:hypothetical protein